MAGCDDARHGRELVGSRQPPLAKVILVTVALNVMLNARRISKYLVVNFK